MEFFRVAVAVCVQDRQEIIFKVILGKVDHMTNCTWIGPAVIVNSILFANYSWYSWSCDHLRLGQQDIIFKVILGKVDHMTNCTWICPAVIVKSILGTSASRIGKISFSKSSWAKLITRPTVLGQSIRFFLQVNLGTVGHVTI